MKQKDVLEMIEKRYIKGKNDVIECAKAKREDWGI